MDSEADSSAGTTADAGMKRRVFPVVGERRVASLKKEHNKNRPRRWIAISIAFVAGAVLVLGIAGGSRFPIGQPYPAASSLESVFTPAHSTFGEAVRHFLGWRSDPVQPIPFRHELHVQEVGLECTFCHSGVTRGPIARIPSVVLCMDCHFDIATDRAPVQLLTSFYDRGQEPPWQRVYGWLPEAHVRFNHAPHIRAEVECATCHGDVASMTVAERVVDHTMSFCVRCHEQNQASIDCVTCHY